MSQRQPGLTVDSHTHVSTGSTRRLSPTIPSFTAPVETLIQVTDAAAVAQVVLIQPSMYGSDHSYLLQCLERFPTRTVGIALVDPSDPSCPARLKDLASSGRVTGLRFAPLIWANRDWFGPAVEPFVELAVEHSLSVNLLVGPQLLDDLDSWIARHSDVVVVIDHLGRPDLNSSSPTKDIEALLRLATHANVRVKLSALPEMSAEPYPHRDTWTWVMAAMAAFGADRCMWGSDFPFTAPGGAYDQSLQMLDLVLEGTSVADIDLVCGGTARATYRLPVTMS